MVPKVNSKGNTLKDLTDGVENIDRAYENVKRYIEDKTNDYEGFLKYMMESYHSIGHLLVSINCNDRDMVKIPREIECHSNYRFKFNHMGYDSVGAR